MTILHIEIIAEYTTNYRKHKRQKWVYEVGKPLFNHEINTCMFVIFCNRTLHIFKMPFYAVAKGRVPGVYATWDQCKQQVNGYNGAKYKKFDTEAEARNFINCATPDKQQQSHLISTAAIASSSSMTSIQNFSQATAPSSPQQKFKALKKRLEFIENQYQEKMEELGNEIDDVRVRMRNFETGIETNLQNYNSSNLFIAQGFKELQDNISQLAASLRDSTSQISAEINKVKERLTNLSSGDEANNIGGPVVGNSVPYRQNLNSALLDATKPVAVPNRSCSMLTQTKHPGKKKRKKSMDEYDLPVVQPKQIKTEPPEEGCVSEQIYPGFEVDADGFVQIYTDGACEKNGRVGARAGVGVFFGDNHPLNYSEPVHGRNTNNTAEIQAATCAVQLAKKAGLKNIVIHTDSEFLINCITIWIYSWKKKDWKLANGEPVKNKMDLMALEAALDGMNVKWNHVRGHRGIHGNEMADRLAREGAKKKR